MCEELKIVTHSYLLIPQLCHFSPLHFCNSIIPMTSLICVPVATVLCHRSISPVSTRGSIYVAKLIASAQHSHSNSIACFISTLAFFVQQIPAPSNLQQHWHTTTLSPPTHVVLFTFCDITGRLTLPSARMRDPVEPGKPCFTRVMLMRDIIGFYEKTGES